jgi:hypothetical protein
MVHPKSKLRWVNDFIGYGVFATDYIPKGTITYVRDELEISVSSERYDSLPQDLKDQVEKYSYRMADGTRIVSWDIAKYMNHCCTPNSMSTGWGFEIAIRDILPGEEITDEYGLFNMDYSFPLSCGEKTCRKMIYPDDIERYGDQWDQEVKGALQDFFSVEQPLLDYLDESEISSLERFTTTGKGYRSVRSLVNSPGLRIAARRDS